MRSLFGFVGNQVACNAYDLCILEDEQNFAKKQKEKEKNLYQINDDDNNDNYL